MSFSEVYTSNCFLGKFYHGIILNDLPPLDLIMHSRSQVVRVEGSHKGMTGSRRFVVEKAKEGGDRVDFNGSKIHFNKKKGIVKVKKLKIFVWYVCLTTYK